MQLNQPSNRRLLKNHDTLIQWIQRLLNALVVGMSLYVCAIWKDEGEFLQHYRQMGVFAILVMLITYHIFGVHRRFESLLGGVQQLARAWGVVVILLAWLAFLTRTSEQYSREVIVYWVIGSFMAQALVQIAVAKIYRVYSIKMRETLPTVVVGTGLVARHLMKSIQRNIWMRDEVIGCVVLDSKEVEGDTIDGISVLGEAKNLSVIISEHGIKKIYLAPTFDQSSCVRKLQEELIDTNIDLVWAPDIFEFHLLNHSVREVSGVPLITLNETPLMSGGPAFLKLLLDKSVALGLILLLMPLLISIALAVKLSSSGPVIFKQRRGGWDGKKFNVYKFRSMYTHLPETVVKQATADDPRITKVGRFLRRTSLDELPQLFNVLNGCMSLVGPRPHAESHDKYYSDKVRAYLTRHRIKPGITGLAQVNGLRGETETIELMQQRVEFDIEYISNWSILLDIKILCLTPISLLSRSSRAY